MTIQDFVRDLKISMTAERTDANPAMEGSRDMDHWKVVFRSKAFRGQMTTVFSMGYGHQGAEPKAKDVLDCLASDASSADESFEDWASNYGYDTDSRKAERTYKAVQRSAARLQKFLGDSAYRTLLQCERE